MVNFRRRSNVNKVIVTVSGVTPLTQEILPAQSGIIYSLVGVIAGELDGVPKALDLYEGGTNIMSQITIGASGSFFWDHPGGEQFELALGSGVFGSVSSSGSVEVSLYYLTHQELTPITKGNARLFTQTTSVSRTPNRFGNQ